MTKAGHLLGIDDAAGAATLQAEMTVLARQQKEELVRRQKAGGLGGWVSKPGGRHLSASAGIASSMASATHASSLSSPSAVISGSGGHADGGRPVSMSGRIVHGTTRENGSSSSAGGAGARGAGRPHAASHDLAAQDGGALREAAAAAEGKGGSGSGGGERSEQRSPDRSGGTEGKAMEAATHGGGIKAAESSPPRPAPLRSKMSWEQDNVGDLIDGDSDAGVRMRVDGAAAVPVGGRQGDSSAATKAGAGGATAGGPSGAEEVGGEGVGQTAADSGAPSATSTTGAKSRERGALSDTENTGQLSLPPLSPAVTAPAAAASTPGSSAAEMSGTHIASQSSLPMPWGTCGFGSTSESPSGGSVKSTAGVLGLGTSESLGDIRERGAIVGDNDWNSTGSEGQGPDVEQGEVGEAAGAAAIVDRGDNSDAEFTSSEHENPSPPGSEMPASPSSATRESFDGESAAAPLEVVSEDGAAVVAEEGEAAVPVAMPRDAGEEEDRLTAAFHAHLTPALCEVRSMSVVAVTMVSSCATRTGLAFVKTIWFYVWLAASDAWLNPCRAMLCLRQPESTYSLAVRRVNRVVPPFREGRPLELVGLGSSVELLKR